MMGEKCGTYAGYQEHGKRGQERCASCRQANAEYMAKRRREDPHGYWAEASKQMARNRALRQLARLFPSELRALYEAELRRLPNRAAS